MTRNENGQCCGVGGLMDKQKIVDTALDLFSKISFSKTSVADIAKACGVGKGTIYLYFQSKDDIFFAIVEKRLQNSIDTSSVFYADPEISLDTKMYHFFENLVDAYFMLKDLMFGSFDNIQGSVLKDVFFKYDKLYQRGIDNLYAIISSNLDKGRQESAQLKQDIAEFMNLIVGRILFALMARDWNDKEGLKTIIAPLAVKLYGAMIA